MDDAEQLLKNNYPGYHTYDKGTYNTVTEHLSASLAALNLKFFEYMLREPFQSMLIKNVEDRLAANPFEHGAKGLPTWMRGLTKCGRSNLMALWVVILEIWGGDDYETTYSDQFDQCCLTIICEYELMQITDILEEHGYYDSVIALGLVAARVSHST